MIQKKEKSEFQSYLVDASNYKGNAGKLVIPESKKELIQSIKEANESKTPITFSGARTGLTGSAIPNEGIIISLEKLNHFYFDSDTKTFTCGPGLIHKELDLMLLDHKRFLPPNPTETLSSIGGNIATNASGSRTFKYGATREWVQELDLILADGTELNLSRQNPQQNLDLLLSIYPTLQFSDINMPDIKHAAGYYLKKGMDPIDLFIGSEGTLACIASAKLKSNEISSGLLGFIIYFQKTNDLLDFVDSTRKMSKDPESIIDARLIEYFDSNSLNVLRKHYSEVPNYQGAIWIEQECEHHEIDLMIEKWYDHIEKFNVDMDKIWVAQNDKEHREFAEFRHKLPEEVYENLADSGREKIGTDCAVPDHLFTDYYYWMYKNLESLDIPFLVFGHIGNSHLHANIFYKNDLEMKRAKEFYIQLIDKTIALGGTVSAEHGIGKIKKVYLEKMFKGFGINKMKEIKDIFDPNNLLGKGNLFS